MPHPLDRSGLPPDSPLLRITDWPGLLAEIRRRPGMWFGRPSVTALGDFVHGMRWSEFVHDVPMEKRLASFPWDEFEAWVVLHFTASGRSPHRSFGLALDLAGSEEAGFNLWLDWYDQFRQS